MSHAHDETPVDNIDVLDFEEATDVAAELGFACTVGIARPLFHEIGARVLLERLRDVLGTTREDPAFELFRAVALRGEDATGARESRELHEAITAFAARVRAGVAGISDTGTSNVRHLDSTEIADGLLALELEGEEDASA